VSDSKRERDLHARRVRHFEAALTQLCSNFGVVFVHEDGHGCAHILPIREGEAAGCRIEIADFVLDESTREHFIR